MSRQLAWLCGAVVLGLLLPAALFAITYLAGYFPIGSWLPKSALWSQLGVFLGLVAIVSLALILGIGWTLLAWNWRPLVLSVAFGLCMFLGLYPGEMAGKYMYRLAIESFKSRSSNLIEAISNYERTERAPPKTLSDLVPAYLPAIPGTGMAYFPAYSYGPTAGPCPNAQNKWHLLVWLPRFISTDLLYYCPKSQDWILDPLFG